MSHPSLIVFDLDGTLIDSVGDLHRALNLMLAEIDAAPLSIEDVKGMVGDGALNLVTRALARRQRTAFDATIQMHRYLQLYEAEPASLTQLYPGVLTTLETLHARGITLVVCTNKTSRLTGMVLEQLGIARYFAAMSGGDSHDFRKPDPRVLTHMLGRFAIDPRHALMVGDSEIDAATAKSAGVPFALVTYGYHRGPLDDIPRTVTIDRFEQLLDLLGQ